MLASVHAFEVLAEPVRRRILELLATGESASGSLVAVLQKEFGISQPAVSQHLKVLRESGFATVRADGARRLYSVDHVGLQEVDGWLSQFRSAWAAPRDALPSDALPSDVSALDALATEVARGKRSRRAAPPRNDEIDEMRNIS